MKLLIPISLLVGACGGSDTDPGAGNDPGGGTQTLVLSGTATAEARVANARVTGDFDTQFSIDLSLGGVAVTTGTVTITTGSGAIPLAFTTNGGNQGRWRGMEAGYEEVYILDVVSGPDTIEGVRVDGPDIHTFSDPVAGATVDSTLPLDVIWARSDEANSASIETDELDPLSIPDSGSHSLPSNTLRTEQGQTRQNTIRVTRTNRVSPGGAAGGSEWAVTIRNEIQVLAAAVP